MSIKCLKMKNYFILRYLNKKKTKFKQKIKRKREKNFQLFLFMKIINGKK